MSRARSKTSRGAAIAIVISGLAASCLAPGCATTRASSSFRAETTTSARLMPISSTTRSGRDVSMPLSVPANVRVPDIYRDLVDRMWLLSPTFRRQCARIERAGNLLVVLEGQPLAPFSGLRARTAIEQRRGGDLRVASVELNPALRDQFVELLAHEFEHIVEWLDGVDHLAVSSRSGVSHGSAGAVETMRAIAIGRLVAGEVAAADGNDARRAGRNTL
jgi:hypothetical protein